MKRRNFIRRGTVGGMSVALGSTAAILGCTDADRSSRQDTPQTSDSARNVRTDWQGTVLQADEGKFIVSGRRRAPMNVKIDSAQIPGVAMSMLVSEVGPGLTIPIHRHRNEDEIIFIHTGQGIVTMGNRRVPSSAGAMLYAPRGVWHGVENTGADTLTWCAIWSPAGFEQYFLEAASLISRPGAPPTREEMDKLAVRYGMEFRGD
ncbi:MAG TPA: cupin domain-containing protein [Gemmatimonadaceae bacterium]|nr:cupin domain-containing protein [Gemmatimonadaceae bacterium]